MNKSIDSAENSWVDNNDNMWCNSASLPLAVNVSKGFMCVGPYIDQAGSTDLQPRRCLVLLCFGVSIVVARVVQAIETQSSGTLQRRHADE
jgi:hypothetical protein